MLPLSNNIDVVGSVELKQLNIGPALFIVIYHALLVVCLPLYFVLNGLPSIWMIVAMLVFIALSGMSITAGYHRYFAHKTFKTNPIIEFVLIIFGTLATQGSVLRWSYDHRLHHRFVDGPKDPYSVADGFWHAHILWIFTRQNPIERKVVADLYKKPLVVWQHNHYRLLLAVLSLGVIVFGGYVFGDLFGAFVFLFLLRVFLLHHSTWSINSLAHYWGNRTFSKEMSAVDNYIIALITFGEGYHNYHHTFASDYRNGVKWWHFDPSKWFVWSLNKLYLASDLKRVQSNTVDRKMIEEDKQLVLDKLRQTFFENKANFEARVNELADRIGQRIIELQEQHKEILEAKRAKRDKIFIKRMHIDAKHKRQHLRMDLREWYILVNKILVVK